MADIDISGQIYMRGHHEALAQEEQVSRRLKKELEEALKREETLRDRLALQESIANKQISQLKAQIKKLQAESGKTPKGRDFTATPVSIKGDHKREGKSRDVRELQKSVSNLKIENESLEQKLQKLTEFVKVASDIKSKAISQCASKNDEIESLQHELRSLGNVYDEEVQRRVKIESELRTLRIYVDYVGNKARERTTNKSTQTEMSVSPNFFVPGSPSHTSQRTSSDKTSFAHFSAAVLASRVKGLEAEHRHQSRIQKSKFHDAVSGPRSSTYPSDGNKKELMSNSRRHKFYSSSTSEAEKLTSKQAMPQGQRPSTRPTHSAPRVRRHLKVRKTLSDESVPLHSRQNGHWNR